MSREENLEVPLKEEQFVDTREKSNMHKKFIAIAALLGLGISLKVGYNQYTNLSNDDLPEDTFQQYLQFVAKYGRTDQSSEEFQNRYQVFKMNYKKIAEHNKLFENGIAQFDMEVNQFADLTEQEFLNGYTGLQIPKNWSENAPSKIQVESLQGRQLSEEIELPDHKDWHAEGKVTTPYDQAGCGGCWAFSTTAGIESLLYISGHDKELTELSVQQLLDCDSTNYGCAGGWMYEGFEYVSQRGLLKKNDYRQFSHSRRKCSISDRELEHKAHVSKIGYRENNGRNNDELRVLLQQQPISIGMLTTGALNAYHSGIVTEDFLRCSDSSREVNHGVLLVGYGSVGDSTNPSGAEHVQSGKCKDYWIIRNSWGSTWGEHGFFRLCADGVGSKQTPLGTCLVNKYATWPTMDINDIDPNE